MWKILVVDDVLANRTLIVDTLHDYANCDIATNGKEAIEAVNLSLHKDKYDLILLDIAMPEMDGLEFLKLLRANELKNGTQLGDGIPVIMVTAFKDPVLESFNEGVDDYIVKPVDPDLLIRKIEEKLGGVEN